MTQYATDELFAVENPVVDPMNSGSPVLLETLGMDVSPRHNNAPYTISDTLSNGADTSRSASKLGNIPGDTSNMLISSNGVFGDGYVLFINRRDGVVINKTDEEGNPLAGSELQVLDSDGAVVHTFTSAEDGVTLVALAPGEYTLHEVSAPEGYLPAEDIAFAVEDQETVTVDGETVEAVTMIDQKKDEPPQTELDEEPKETPSGSGGTTGPAETKSATKSATKPADKPESPSTGDDAIPGMMAGLLVLSLGVLAVSGRKRGGCSK